MREERCSNTSLSLFSTQMHSSWVRVLAARQVISRWMAMLSHSSSRGHIQVHEALVFLVRNAGDKAFLFQLFQSFGHHDLAHRQEASQLVWLIPGRRRMLIKWVEVRLVSPRGCSRSLTAMDAGYFGDQPADAVGAFLPGKLGFLLLFHRPGPFSCEVGWSSLSPVYGKFGKMEGEKGPFGNLRRRNGLPASKTGDAVFQLLKSLPDIHGKTAEYSHFILYFCKLIRYNK